MGWLYNKSETIEKLLYRFCMGTMVESDVGNTQPKDAWSSGEGYEPYVGRWSRLVARLFIDWLAVPSGRRWLDVGCGTGALTETILERANPERVKGIDAAESFIAYAGRKIVDPRASFEHGDAQGLPAETSAYDAVVSGLVLNFVPRPEAMIREMVRAARPGSVVGLYVWDYAGGMQFLRHFWNAAAALFPQAAELDEGRRFPLCNPGPLESLFSAAGLAEVTLRPIDIWTIFADFDDFWAPFLHWQGPAPGFLMSLPETERERLRERLWTALPFALDGSIPLVARAWAIRGTR